MQLFDWLIKRDKPISQLTRSEIRREELMLEKENARLLIRIKKLATEKQSIFDQGAKEKTPEVRQALAQQFEIKTTEQLMVSRQLNIRGKELLTVSRLRMLRENSDRAKESGGKLGLITEGDILRLGKLIENDAIRSEVYQERLDDVLGAAAAVDQGGSALSDSGKTVMNIWDKMDTGDIGDSAEAFDEADRRVREEQKAAEESM